MPRQLLSAVIITLNEASRIERCIKSVSFCDEIVVVDSGSCDGTQEICRKLGAKVIEQDWLGYGAQKQFAVDQADFDWVLCLDADEALSEELGESIQTFLQSPPSASAGKMPRCNRFMGRWLRYGEGYPDLSLRLFDRSRGRWSEDPVHEKVICDGEIVTLNGDLLHRSEESIGHYLEKQNRYTSLQAEVLAKSDKPIKTAKLVLSPLIRFLKFYFIRQGFRDGLPGLVHICIGCFNSFIKYAKAKDLRNSK
ncbi:MAG: glycosyltransferase family 2 protein [Neptuniibacter sp.]